MDTGQNKEPLKVWKPRTIAEAGKRIQDTHQIILRVSRNGGYSRQTKDELLHVLSSATDEVIAMLKDILAYDPEFPKMLSFSQAWCIDEQSISKLSASELTRLKTNLQAIRRKAMKVYSLEAALALANSKAWDENKFKKWQEEYWNPKSQMEKDSLEKVWPETLDAYFTKLSANLANLLTKIKQIHLSNFGLQAGRYLADTTGSGDVVSFFEKAKHLFTVWNEVQWDNGRNALILRGTAYGPYLDEKTPLTSDVESDNSSEAVELWNRTKNQFTDEESRKVELLKRLNLIVYRTIKKKLDMLEEWKSEDDERMQELKKLLNNDLWTGENYREQRWFARCFERPSLRKGKERIETFLSEHGFDAETVIKDFLETQPEIETQNSGDKESQLRQNLAEATKLANAQAYQIACDWRDQKKSVPFGRIAEQVMVQYFTGLILRVTGRTMKNRQEELTKAWKHKRTSIRVGLMRKFPKK